MTILYIDTSSSYLYTGIVQENILINSRKECLSNNLSTFAIDEIRKMFEEVNLKPNDVDKIIVVNGPGSFTGIRIGITISKIFAWSLNKKITMISSLEAMVKSVQSNKLIVPIINARRGYVYGAIYQNNEIVLEGEYISLEKLNLFLKGLNKEYSFVSNDKFDFECLKYDPDILNIVLSYKDREDVNPHMVNPCYLKLTEAEENRLKENDN